MTHPKTEDGRFSDDGEAAPATADDATDREIDSDAALSPVVEQQGGAALGVVGKRKGSELFKDD